MLNASKKQQHAPTAIQEIFEKGDYSPIPNELWRSNVSESAKCLWGYLHSQSIKFNPRYDQIHEETGKRRPSINGVLNELVENNMISISHGKDNSNIYNLKPPSQWLRIRPKKDFGSNETVPTEKSGSNENVTTGSNENVPTGSNENVPTNNTKNKTKNNTKLDIPSGSKKPHRFKFEQWQIDLAKKWIEYNHEYYPDSKPNPEDWANQIRIICNKRKHLNQESFTALLDSVRRDSFWHNKATSIPSLNKPSGSNPDVLKLDNAIKAVSPPPKRNEGSIDDLFREELNAMKNNQQPVIDVDINNLKF